MDIAKEIRKYIETNNVPQNKLAEKSGVGKVQLCRVLRGQRKLSVEEYVNICDALCVPLERFIFQSNRTN